MYSWNVFDFPSPERMQKLSDTVSKGGGFIEEYTLAQRHVRLHNHTRAKNIAKILRWHRPTILIDGSNISSLNEGPLL